MSRKTSRAAPQPFAASSPQSVESDDVEPAPKADDLGDIERAADKDEEERGAADPEEVREDDAHRPDAHVE